MIYVVGSGPTGMACAWMLLKKGLHVTMLDAGVQLEERRRTVVGNMREKKPQDWDEHLLHDYKSGFQVHAKGVKCKPSYGSLFPYKDVAPYKSFYKDVSLYPSYAQGGLSNVWGASIAAFKADDLQGWPISREDLNPYYQQMLSILPVAKAQGPSAIFEGLGRPRSGELKMSRQICELNDRIMDRKVGQGQLVESIGGSCLAVGPSPGTESARDCIYCGLCMYGCPFSLIYNSAFMLNELKQQRSFEYRDGIFVDSVTEVDGEVRINGHHVASGQPQFFHAEKVYLGAGVFSTSRIMLSSWGEYDDPLYCLDSQYFLLPLLSTSGCKGATNDDLHTLAQLCLQVKPFGNEKAAFLQIYGYNDLYLQAIKSLSGPMYPILSGFARFFLERLFLIQAFLHSDNSHAIKIQLKKNGQGSDELFFEGVRSDAAKKALKNVLGKTSDYFRSLGIFALTPLMDPGLPGRGYHSGGTFPMRQQPRHRETDVLGRPYGFERVHLVDASVFPAIPAGPITFSAMANSARIADQSSQGL